MTLAEYLDPSRFPLTTQDGLTPRVQLAYDAYNLAQLRELRDDGRDLTEDEQARLAELEKKSVARPALLDELVEAGG
jgi:hypothetical protein